MAMKPQLSGPGCHATSPSAPPPPPLAAQPEGVDAFVAQAIGRHLQQNRRPTTGWLKARLEAWVEPHWYGIDEDERRKIAHGSVRDDVPRLIGQFALIPVITLAGALVAALFCIMIPHKAVQTTLLLSFSIAAFAWQSLRFIQRGACLWYLHFQRPAMAWELKAIETMLTGPGAESLVERMAKWRATGGDGAWRIRDVRLLEHLNKRAAARAKLDRAKETHRLAVGRATSTGALAALTARTEAYALEQAMPEALPAALVMEPRRL